MQIRRTGPGIGIAYRRAGTVAAVAVCLAFGPVFAGNALAFKLFGINFFGKDETTEQVIDPVRYTVDLRTGDADKDLKDAITQSSMLVADKDKPVSGDLGAVIKARDDRERILAALYEKSHYGGVVTISLNGTNLDDLA